MSNVILDEIYNLSYELFIGVCAAILFSILRGDFSKLLFRVKEPKTSSKAPQVSKTSKPYKSAQVPTEAKDIAGDPAPAPVAPWHALKAKEVVSFSEVVTKLPPKWMNVTTVRVNNLPRGTNQNAVREKLDDVGFLNTYDFLFVPEIPEQRIRYDYPYAFINFVDSETAQLFKLQFEGRMLLDSTTLKACCMIAPADVQGYAANWNLASEEAFVNLHTIKRSPSQQLQVSIEQEKLIDLRQKRHLLREATKNRNLPEQLLSECGVPQTEQAEKVAGEKDCLEAFTATQGWAEELRATPPSSPGRDGDGVLPEDKPKWTNVTTVSVGRLPAGKGQTEVCDKLDEAGFVHTYDFVYLPPSRRAKRQHHSGAFASINFFTSKTAYSFKQQFDGRVFIEVDSAKACSVVPAAIQGYEANCKQMIADKDKSAL